MTIECKFSVILADRSTKEKRRIPLTEVQAVTGITWQTLQKWSLNKAKSYDAKVLSSLCQYFDCQPGDILVYTPDIK
jgi:putative transcriptional regulator